MKPASFLWRLLTAIVLIASCHLAVLSAAEPAIRAVYKDAQQQQQTATGRVLVEAQDGGLMLQAADGSIETIAAENLNSREATTEPFRPLTAQEMGKQLRDELGPQFEITHSEHYVICSNAGDKYARWSAGLFERLHAGFENYWKRRGLELTEPDFPLAAIIFARREDFAAYATTDAGPDVANARGYYSLKSNRVVLYDLSGLQNQQRAKSVAEINRRMTRAPFNTATVVHEATHQIAFNRGLHTRYADNPLWLTEGMAMYFETPDLRSRSGWRTIGKVNPFRKQRFQQLLKRRPVNSLQSLVQSDARLLDAESAEDAYAESWALNYYLIKRHGDAYAAYLKSLAAKKPLRYGTEQQRLAEFKAAFGDDLSKLERDWLRFMNRAR